MLKYFIFLDKGVIVDLAVCMLINIDSKRSKYLSMSGTNKYSLCKNNLAVREDTPITVK